MLDIKSCLKISFQGEVGFVICEAGSSYDQIITQACARFHIADIQRAGLKLTNGQGYVFEQQLLEYFLLLFPCPELLFYLRLDWQQLRRALVEPIKRRRSTDDDIHDKTHQFKFKSESEAEYMAVPVYRQNCFIGTLPGNPSAAAGAAAAAAAASVRRQHCSMRQQVQKQQQHNQEQSYTQSQPKRMRIQLYNKSRRTLPSTATHSALLATAPRSIRI
ncbi:uncharacterized protein LOC6565338 [Drosophila grimshawi]|uniref:GH12412 n=1 Tax=Drosophila grimshawi TaxID=7222 RepID=B4JIZ3_DROGR|nr:uncharacterized protein LOC6565338 [Drosophila grimshawi]XP_043072368.1 uncharacterized protein LOC6565338 [Drosophila grimshawi]EDV99557.1 GH12412 [Drosophila grimshawi]